MSELTSLKNIGVEMARKLQSVGINTAEELVSIGSKEAYCRLKVKYSNICLVFLYVLQGAIENKDYNSLSEKTKSDLKEFNNQLKVCIDN